MKKLFISQPMKGKTEEEILAERKKAIESAKEYLGEDVEVIDSYFEDYNPENGCVPLKYLSKSLELLADADVAYFAKGWEDARGCRIENQCAIDYGIDVIENYSPKSNCKGKGMSFQKAYEALKQGAMIKCPEWAGYWKWEDNSIKMHCKDGKILDIRESENVDYTLNFILRDDWEIAGEEDVKDLNIQTFTFGEAVRRLKAGQKITRKGWNGKGMFVVYQKGYPDGIPCNKQTAEAWGMNEGDLFKCNPYLQIRQPDGSHSMWVPSIGDVLAEDWIVLSFPDTEETGSN